MNEPNEVQAVFTGPPPEPQTHKVLSREEEREAQRQRVIAGGGMHYLEVHEGLNRMERRKWATDATRRQRRRARRLKNKISRYDVYTYERGGIQPPTDFYLEGKKEHERQRLAEKRNGGS